KQMRKAAELLRGSAYNLPCFLLLGYLDIGDEVGIAVNVRVQRKVAVHNAYFVIVNHYVFREELERLHAIVRVGSYADTLMAYGVNHFPVVGYVRIVAVRHYRTAFGERSEAVTLGVVLGFVSVALKDLDVSVRHLGDILLYLESGSGGSYVAVA